MFDQRHRVIPLFQTLNGKLSGQTSATIFFDQYRGIMCFCQGWLMFSMPSKRKHAGVGRHTTSVELERKNLADLHCNFYCNNEQKSILYHNKLLSASVCKKNCAKSAGKYHSRLYNDRCRLLYFLFNP